ncbi:poly [ADP-ribose] polymerase 14-like [Solea senegalensis]|uniref:Poly [ADP-ribose] polymerase n=1 Tax=Solea senegalensis TaxID=28829 RepID=A0AAV6QWN7_SOLSE|nr:protein mono-ADP-ribosyltransferase PARP14-like [Solea senegalensis]KAG7496605.1 poly [ADP-ribose] polymerase 14-like [Solea senegalensis]
MDSAARRHQHVVVFQCRSLDRQEVRRVENYFHIRRKSGGGECGSVSQIGDKVYSIAFKEREAQQRVLQRPEHVLELADGPLVLTIQSSIGSPSSAPTSISTSVGAKLSVTSSQSSQSTPASIPPSSGEEYELQCDTYLQNYLKECDKAGKELETELASMACTAQFYPEKGRVLFRRLAQPDAADEGTKWKSEVNKLFDGYLCHFEVNPHKVKALLQPPSSHKDLDQVKVYDEVGMAVVVGKRVQVNARLTEIEGLVVKPQSFYKKETCTRRLGEAKLRLLWKEIEHDLGQKCPGIKVTQGDSGQVVLEGSVLDIVEADELIAKAGSLVSKRTVSDISPHLLAFLRKTYGGQGMLSDILGVGDAVEIELRDTEICFLSLSADNLDDSAKKMKEKFKEIKIFLPHCATVPPELRNKLQFKSHELNQGQHRAQVLFGPANAVYLVGHTKEVEDLNETVQECILDQASIDSKVILPFPELVQLLPELLQLHKFDYSGVIFHPLTFSSKSTVGLEGPSGKVTEVRNRLGPFLDSLVQDNVTINLPGALRYFESPLGQESILKVARSQKCLIKLCEELQASQTFTSGATLSNGGNTVASYTLCDGLQVVVCLGDITKQHADALVNAANEDLDHCGGVAAALSKAGGPKIQKESNAIVKQTGKIRTGDVVVTTGGSLRCKTLLHAVGPVAKKSGGNERFLLEKAVHSTLNMAESMEISSIAIPCISSGVFGVPVTVCSEAIVTAVKEFGSQGGRSLRRITLIDNRGEVVRAMQGACDRLFQGTGTTLGTPSNLGLQLDATAQDAARGATGGPPEVKVEIVEGTIETQLVDGLVCPMSGHDHLSSRIGCDLSNMVGPQLNAKFHKEARGATLPGDIVLLVGLAPLPSKAVFFLNLLPWDNNEHGTAVQALRQGIRKILASCEIRVFTSLALPVLGTGAVLQFPHTTASRVILEELRDFEQNRVSGLPFLVRVVIHPTDKKSSKAFQSAQQTLNFKGFTNDAHPDQATFYRHVSRSNIDSTAMLGGVKLQMLCGNIVNGGTDVIVNTTDFSNNHSGVSKAILTAAGPSIEAELKQLGTPADHMCTTGPGLLSCREIIHASFSCDPVVIQKNCKKILKQCESKGYQSVSFPAVSTGLGGMDSVRACKAMLDGMAAEIRDLKPNSLSLIRIVILQQPIFQVFRSELESRFGQIAPQRSLGEKAKQFWKSLRPSSALQDKTFMSSKPQPAVLNVICCGPGVVMTIKRDLEGILQKQLIQREVDVHDFSRLEEMELEAVLSKVRVLGISLECERRQSDERAKGKRAGDTGRANARDQSGTGDEVCVLRGLKEDVLSVTELINKAIHNALCEDIQDKNEAMTSLAVQWSIQDVHEVWQELSQHDNYVLEEAHRMEQLLVDITAPDATIANVDLRTLKATNLQTGIKYNVRRKETGATFEYPAYWEPMQDETFKKVELHPNTNEYQSVAQAFLATAKYRIQKIERVQNNFLWQAFSVCKQRLLSKNGLNELGEKILYHGTSEKSCKCIEKDRFDRSYVGTHGAMYGNGVYFAVNAQYSASKFSPADASGLKRLFVARVLTGRFTRGYANMKSPPPRGTDHTDCFDSLVDDQQQPTMFVIFRDDQAYPEYLVTFA